MRCAVCGKESNNQRMCPHCFTPYGPQDASAPDRRTTERMPARPTERVTARTTAAVPPRETTATARRATGELPAPGEDPALDRALSGLSMEEVMPSSGETTLPAVIRGWQWYRAQTPIVRWTIPAIVALLLFALIPIDDGANMGPGVTVPKMTPDAKVQAESLVAATAQRATVEQSGEELVVTYAVTGFPAAESEQLALAESYARADALVQGRRRTIYFYTPQGRVFAKSDSVVGVVLRQ